MSPLPIQSDPGKHALMEPVPLYEEEKQIRANNLSVGAPLDAREAEKYEDTFSAGAIFRGEAGHNVPTTPFELKAALINAELDKMGLGRYQKCIWLLCGFGYFVDLLWAQAVGLMAISIYQEMDVPDDKTGLIFTANSAGLTIGAFTFGLLVDIIGRKWAFNTTVLITCFFGTMLAAVKNNYNAICAVTALCGFGLGGQIPIDATITLEYLPQNRRYLLSLLSMWQPIGVVIASAICYGTVPKWRCPTTEPPLESCMVVADGEPCCSISSNYGWRVAAGVLGGITLLIFFARVLFFKFHESPKYLLGRGREAEAIEVLHKIAAFNRQDPPALTLEHFAEIDQRQSVISDPVSTTPLTTAQTSKKVLSEFVRRTKHLKGLFASKLMIFTSMILIIAYIGDFWSFNLAGSYLPIILQRRNVSSGQGTVTDTYRQYVYIYLPGIIGAIMAMFFVQLPVIGRKWSLVFGAAMQGLAMAMYTQVGTTAGYVGLNAMEYIFQTFFNAILYATTPELFPAYVRGSASGLLSTCGRLSGIVAPFAAQDLLASKSSGILWLATGGIWVSMLALVFLPIETRKRASY